MKKFFLMTALSLGVFAFSNAQQANNQLPQVRAKAMVSKITNACSLQGDQVGKVNILYTEYFTKMDALGANPAPAKVADLNKEVDAQLKGTLTASQYTQFKSIK